MSYCSKNQATVAISTCEAEYLSGSQALREILFFRRMKVDTHRRRQADSIPPHVDKHSVIIMACNPANTKRRKHIDGRAHYLGHHQRKKSVKLEHFPSHSNLSDILTKSADKTAFDRLKLCLLKNPCIQLILELPGE